MRGECAEDPISGLVAEMEERARWELAKQGWRHGNHHLLRWDGEEPGCWVDRVVKHTRKI